MDEQVGHQEPKPSRMRRKHIVFIAVFIILALLFLSSGASVLYYNLGTDADGYVYSNVYQVNTSAYAFTAYMNNYTMKTWGFLGVRNVAEMKFIATPTDPTKDLFIGYATTAASWGYRSSFQCEIPTNWYWWAGPYFAEINITTTLVEGSGAPLELPQNQSFWVASDQGPGLVSMTYLPLDEQHVWFIMNSDGSRNVSAAIQIGFRSPILMVLPPVLIVIGFVFLGGGVYFFLKKKKK